MFFKICKKSLKLNSVTLALISHESPIISTMSFCCLVTFIILLTSLEFDTKLQILKLASAKRCLHLKKIKFF